MPPLARLLRSALILCVVAAAVPVVAQDGLRTSPAVSSQQSAVAIAADLSAGSGGSTKLTLTLSKPHRSTRLRYGAAGPGGHRPRGSELSAWTGNWTPPRRLGFLVPLRPVCARTLPHRRRSRAASYSRDESRRRHVRVTAPFCSRSSSRKLTATPSAEPPFPTTHLRQAERKPWRSRPIPDHSS